jgi:hypothetical protein
VIAKGLDDRPQRLAVRELNVDVGLVLRETRDVTSARQLGDPGGEDSLDVVLPQPEPVVCRVGKSLIFKGMPANLATCATCPCESNLSAIPH